MHWVTSTKTVVGKFNIRTSWGLYNIPRSLASEMNLVTEGIKVTYLSYEEILTIKERGRMISTDLILN